MLARGRGAQEPAAAPGHADHRRRGAQLLGARDARGAGRGGLRLGHHLRRRHRAGVGAAHLGVGRRRPPHRARDQEPADPHTTFGRAPAPQVRQGDHRGPRGVRALHRHHHPPGRRRDAHGRRVLRLRAHAQAADGGSRHPRRRARRRARPPDDDRRRRLRDQGRQGADHRHLRPPADLAGHHQPRQERPGGGPDLRRERRQGAGLARPHRDGRAPQRRPRRHRGDRQRRRACPSTTATACSSPTSRPRATRAPGSASPSCKRASSSTAARCRWRTPRRRPGAAHGALIRITLPVEQDAGAGRSRATNPHPPPPTAARDRQRAEGATDGI